MTRAAAMAAEGAALTGGFARPGIEAARAFRVLLEAMARPGTIRQLAGAAPPPPLSPAAGAVLLTLCDAATPLFLAGAHDAPAVRRWIAFHTGAPVPADPGAAAFALGAWPALTPLDRFARGTPEYPDRSATLIVELERLAPEGARLTGPGIRTEARLNLPDPELLAANAAAFPLGLDFLFCAGDRVAALPRSTRVEAI
jgi:alpha-D-ribose 1-methylphosphonate 5-triphosphate synthase subunit PhnH